jgi:pimeloyl-ACP methyl ester carboxylesterase
MDRRRKIHSTIRSSILLIALAACAFLSSRSSIAHQSKAPSYGRIAFQACHVPGFDGEARCGSYEVYEDRAARRGRKIRLHIVVVPAASATPAPDPAYWLHGGPGAAATQSIPNVQGGFLEGVHKNRDIIFVDQRGTGSSNPLMCDVGDDPKDLSTFFGPLFPLDKVRECRQRLEKVADLRLYTTPIAMDDLDEVRAAMGYDRINLVAASYGTIAAQVYMRRHPEHLRSVFLLGIAAPGFKQPLPFAKGAQHSLDLLVQDCAADPGCHSNFPRLREEFDAVLARFNQGPVQAALIAPGDKKKQTVPIVRASFVERLRLMLYTTGSARFLPFIIHRAYENDYLPFEGASLASNTGGILARGMYLTVTCSEGVPFITEQDIASDTSGTFVGPGRVRAHIAACKEWVRGEVGPNYTDFVKSDVPVLLVAGELDAASPPWFADSIVKHLPHGREIKIRFSGHQFDPPCVPDLLTKFIEKGSADGLDVSCTEKIRRPPFATELPRNISLD